MTLVAEGLNRVVGGEVHLEGLGFTLERGQFYTILGPTLSGKTSLLRVLAGLDPVDSGLLSMDGKPMQSTPVWKRSVSMVYQQFINYPHLNVYENIAFPLLRMKLPAAEIDQKVRAMAEKVGLADFLERMCGELSGGQQQRTALARSLVKGSDLLLMDEPLVNLDYKLREQLRDEFINLFSDKGDSIVVYASTEPTEVLMLGGTVLVMNEGRLLQMGPTHEVFSKPASEEVAKIFNDPPMNLIDGSVEGNSIILAGGIHKHKEGHLSELPDGKYKFGIRAADIGIGEDGVEVKIDLAEISGSVTFLHASLKNTQFVIEQEGVHTHGLQDVIKAEFDARAFYAFKLDGRLAAAPYQNNNIEMYRE